MDEKRVANLIGALALGLADEVLEAADGVAPEPGLAGAALTLMAHIPGLSIERLRRSLGLSHPGAVRLVDRLERAGLAERSPSAADGRAVALGLTEHGARSCAAILAARGGLMARALGALTDAERDTLGALAEKMLRGMVRDVDHAYAVCRLCDPGACVDCPIDAEMERRSTPSTP